MFLSKCVLNETAAQLTYVFVHTVSGLICFDILCSVRTNISLIKWREERVKRPQNYYFFTAIINWFHFSGCMCSFAYTS